MDTTTRQRLDAFLQPLYQDLDGASHRDDVLRIERIARALYAPSSESDALSFDLLIVFHPLGKWLDRLGNASRTTLAVAGLTEEDLRRTAASIKRLDAPVSDAERAVAAAILIDGAGVRGLIDQFARARREGNSLMDVVRAAVADVNAPDWLPPEARNWLHARRESRREMCRRLLSEIDLADLGV